MAQAFTLYPYQTTGAAWLSSLAAGLLGDEPGLGKTIQAITASDTVGALSVLVLCQSVGKSHWREKFLIHQTIKRAVTVINGTSQAVPLEGVVIVNYDVVSRADCMTTKALLRRKWDVVIIDEGHALKTRTSKRTKVVYGKKTDRIGSLTETAKHVWVLSGTLAPNHAGELWTHLHALAPITITDPHKGRPLTEDEFVQHFCMYRDTVFGRQITGSKNIETLRGQLAPVMIRRRKADVLTDLPPLTFDTVVVNPNDAKVPASLLRELGHVEMELSSDLAFANDFAKNDAPELVDILKGMRTDTHIATQRRLVGQIKAQIAIDLVAGEIKGSREKIILFAYHQEVIDALMTGLADAGLGAVKIDGRDKSSDRDQSVHAFMTDPACQVFVGQITAAGTSITLTSASNVLFVEPSWVPSENVQAACRAHRIGQLDGVLARFLALDGSLDKQIMAAHVRKARDIAALMDDDPTAQAVKGVPNTPSEMPVSGGSPFPAYVEHT
jgi:SWI/SNF-related matrix-associated actin-dependent regulator 1 of chromatin subfamily A